MECVNITIVDDTLEEAEESFAVVVVSGGLVLAQVSIIIESSDGKQTIHMQHLLANSYLIKHFN